MTDQNGAGRSSATDELRRMLDERGVEWRDSSDENVLHTTWSGMSCWFNEFPDGWTAWGMAMRGTPEQAIAATLGADAKPTEAESSGTCYITDNGTWGYPYVCSACGASFDPDVNNGEFNYCPNCGKRVVEPTTNDADAEVEQ